MVVRPQVWHSLHVPGPARWPTPPEDAWSGLQAAASVQMDPAAERPKIFVVAGNYRGLFRTLDHDGLSGLKVRVVCPESLVARKPGLVPLEVRAQLAIVLGTAVALVNPVFCAPRRGGRPGGKRAGGAASEVAADGLRAAPTATGSSAIRHNRRGEQGGRLCWRSRTSPAWAASRSGRRCSTTRRECGIVALRHATLGHREVYLFTEAR
jgi:hypothetical protein